MFNKLVRIGRNAELRRTAGGKAVVGLACVYDIGWGDNKRSQWLEAVIWGKQAESLAQYLLKGQQIVIYADDLEVEQYEHNGKTGSKLKCRVINIDLTDNKQSEPQQQAPMQTNAYQAPEMQKAVNNHNASLTKQAPQQQNNGFNDSFDDDIPF